jgi:hypothetical protein
MKITQYTYLFATKEEVTYLKSTILSALWQVLLEIALVFFFALLATILVLISVSALDTVWSLLVR